MSEQQHVVVIGATGHIGSYLVPRLVRAGHRVTAVSRGTREPYHADAAWEQVETVVADREAEAAAGTFGTRMADLHPDVVVDLVCFTLDQARELVEALRPTGAFLAHCGTIWVHGVADASPLREDDPKEPFGPYGTQKAAIEEFLHAETRSGGLRSTVVHPGHISGPGWPVITPLGNLDPGSGRRWRPAGNCWSPGWDWRPCTTSTPTTSRRCSNWRWPVRRCRPARASTPCPTGPSPSGVSPVRPRRGGAGRRTCGR